LVIILSNVDRWLSFSSAVSAVIMQHRTNIYINIKTYHSSAVLLINDFFKRKAITSRQQTHAKHNDATAHSPGLECVRARQHDSKMVTTLTMSYSKIVVQTHVIAVSMRRRSIGYTFYCHYDRLDTSAMQLS